MAEIQPLIIQLVSGMKRKAYTNEMQSYFIILRYEERTPLRIMGTNMLGDSTNQKSRRTAIGYRNQLLRRHK
jgi:hypothetical protein